jgi:hypothetical protein
MRTSQYQLAFTVAVLVIVAFVTTFLRSERDVNTVTELATEQAVQEVVGAGTDPNPFPFYGITGRVTELKLQANSGVLCMGNPTADALANRATYEATVQLQWLGLIPLRGEVYRATCYEVHLLP